MYQSLLEELYIIYIEEWWDGVKDSVLAHQSRFKLVKSIPIKIINPGIRESRPKKIPGFPKIGKNFGIPENRENPGIPENPGFFKLLKYSLRHILTFYYPNLLLNAYRGREGV